MDILVTDILMRVLIISSIFSIIEMALVQKIKKTTLLKKQFHLEIFHLISSIILGTLFSISFFNLNVIFGLWVSLFSFIGASSIYEIMKNQTIISYKPKSLTKIKKN